MRWRRLSVEANRLHQANPFRALINIGEDWIRALVVEIEPQGTGLLGGAREKRGAPYTLNSVEYVADLCERALTKAERATESTLGHRVVADSALLGVPDTWSVVASGTIRQRRREPERRMDASECRGVLERAVAFVLAQQGEGQHSEETEVIHAAVTEVRMDGQRLSDPIGFRGEELCVGITLSLIRPDQSFYLREIGRELDLQPVVLVPLLQALAICLPAAEAIGILLDDSHTDVFRLLDRRVVATRRIPEGVRHMLLGVTSALGVAAGDAHRLQRAHQRGLLRPELAGRLEKELVRQMWLWAMEARSAVRSVAGDAIPSRVYLCGSGEGTKSLQAILASAKWRKGMPFVRNPQVACFGPGDVAPVLDRTGDQRTVGDLGIRCLAVYAQAIAQPLPVLDVLLDEVLRSRGYVHSE